MRSVVALAVFALTTFLPATASAQRQPGADPGDPNRWGVALSFVPNWEISGGESALAKLGEVMLTRGDEGLSVQGGDLRIGIVRGRRLRGEWGISFVRRSFDDGSTQGRIEPQCSSSGPAGQEICFTTGTEYIYGNDVRLSGIEANKLLVFGTIQKRVQIGLDLAGGIGWIKGRALERNAQSGGFSFGPETPSPIIVPFQIVETPVEAKTLSAVDPTPIGRVELAVGVVLPANLKVRVSGGMNLPGTHIASVTLVYLFGRP